MRPLRLISIIAAGVGVAMLLSGCVSLKPGSYSLTQPAGIGATQLKFAACSVTFTEPEPGVPNIECGPAKEPEAGQMLLGLVVPIGTATPESIPAVPGPGAAATTFARSAALAAQLNGTELSEGSTGPPPGFEIAAYVSGVVSESGAQELVWNMEATLGLPPVADGGSYGGPFGANLVVGWRNVTPEASSSRPINCKEEGGAGATYCGFATAEAPIGVSDLKIRPPTATGAVPGAKVKLPFVLDFASSSAELPKFKLAVGSKLPGAELSLSNSAFTRAPTNATTKRAPATTRTAIVQVPKTARLGSYEVSLSATADKGGVATGAVILSVGPKGRAKVTAPKSISVAAASARGIPVKLFAPIAGTRFITTLKGPARLSKKKTNARALGTSALRMRVPAAAAAAASVAGTPLKLEVKVRQPGLKKVVRLTRRVKLR